MKSVMTHSFSQQPKVEVPRSVFNRSCGHLTTFDVDYLVPVFIDEALPGDTIKMNMTAFARLNTPINPIMDNMYLDTFFFAVPNRLIWDNWQKFCGEQVDPGDSIAYTIPGVAAATTADLTTANDFNSLCNYFGLPYKNSVDTSEISALPFRAYNLIYNEWFRDENLQDSLTVSTDDGPDSGGTDYAIKKRGKRHDYFTSCLPWPQKGTAVELPLGTTAPINRVTGLAQDGQLYYSNNDVAVVGVRALQAGATTGNMEEATGGAGIYYDPMGTLETDLSSATAATINQIREAFQIQKLMERDARGGTRYTEIIRSHFGVTSPDQRVQRPEYLGGGSTRINITPIAQTSSTDATTPQGNLSAFGTAHVNNNGFVKSFTEHCIVIGLVNVRADLRYQQGLERMWSRSTRYDYYWPSLANIGEQAVLNSEIYYQNTAADDNVFGYQGRYDEYRYKPSRLSGLMQSAHASSLDAWHLTEEFSGIPTLGSTFIESNTPIDRVVAVTTEPDFLFDSFFEFQHIRPMPAFSVPGLIDHF